MPSDKVWIHGKYEVGKSVDYSKEANDFINVFDNGESSLNDYVIPEIKKNLKSQPVHIKSYSSEESEKIKPFEESIIKNYFFYSKVETSTILDGREFKFTTFYYTKEKKFDFFLTDNYAKLKFGFQCEMYSPKKIKNVYVQEYAQHYSPKLVYTASFFDSPDDQNICREFQSFTGINRLSEGIYCEIDTDYIMNYNKDGDCVFKSRKQPNSLMNYSKTNSGEIILTSFTITKQQDGSEKIERGQVLEKTPSEITILMNKSEVHIYHKDGLVVKTDYYEKFKTKEYFMPFYHAGNIIKFSSEQKISEKYLDKNIPDINFVLEIEFVDETRSIIKNKKYFNDQGEIFKKFEYGEDSTIETTYSKK